MYRKGYPSEFRRGLSVCCSYSDGKERTDNNGPAREAVNFVAFIQGTKEKKARQQKTNERPIFYQQSGRRD
jgi:hypothetical protein